MSAFIEIIKYIFLGIVQGITEIFPISSSGHLVFFQTVFQMEEPGLVFEMFTNTASFLALFALFFPDIFRLIKNFFRYIFKKERADYKTDFDYVLKLLVAVIPIGIIGLLFKDEVEKIKNLLTVGFALIITGALLLAIFFNQKGEEDHEDISFKDALFIGLGQAFAVVPGISRSGSTIIGGRFRRVSLKSILRFSFLAYLIISVPTSVLGFVELGSVTETINWVGYSLAFIFAFAATFLTGYLVMKKLKVNHMLYYGLYVLVLGAISLMIYFL